MLLSDDNLHELVCRYLAASAEVKRRMSGLPAGGLPMSTVAAASTPFHIRTTEGVAGVRAIVAAARLVTEAFRGGGKLLLCGNGGSAADCQHMAAEFTGLLRKDHVRPGLPAIALTTDTSFLTAYANDVDFNEVFARQVEALGRPGDVLLAISTSGNSENVLRAVRAARARGMQSVALSGIGGALAELADITVAVPSRVTAHIQEAHLAIEHAIGEAVELLLADAHAIAPGSTT